MKKLAVTGSGRGTNFEAIAGYFKDKDVEITCISDVEDSLILKKAKEQGINAVYLPYENNTRYFRENKFDLIALAGYMRILTPETLAQGRFINVHPALLPAFRGKNAIKRAFDKGVKVTGVTIHYVNENVDDGKIIAQYPVFIEDWMNVMDLEEEIHALEHKLYPIVIDTLLKDTVFDFSMLLKNCNSRSRGCGGGGCCGSKSSGNSEGSECSG